MAFELKRLPRTSLGEAIEKAAHYRDLNQPEEAESICRDVLDVDPEHQAAYRILGLALTDRLATGEVGLLEASIDAFDKLLDEYERVYHVGVAWERAAKAHLERGEGHSAVAAFERAMWAFEEAQALRPELADPILRWNRCVRLMSTHSLLRAALEAPREGQVHLGD